MNLDGVTQPWLRVLLDFQPPCVETHAADFTCTFLSAGARLRCR